MLSTHGVRPLRLSTQRGTYVVPPKSDDAAEPRILWDSFHGEPDAVGIRQLRRRNSDDELDGFVHFKWQRLSIGSGVGWRSMVA
jgi:hypothetical protein